MRLASDSYESLAAIYSIASSASASNLGGTSMPKASPVWPVMMNSNVTVCMKPFPHSATTCYFQMTAKIAPKGQARIGPEGIGKKIALATLAATRIAAIATVMMSSLRITFSLT